MKTRKLIERYGEFSTTVWVDERDEYVTIWHVEPPPLDSRFTVVRDEWIEEGPLGVERHIFEWKPVS